MLVYSEAKALIFDLDGTLSDSLPLHIATWNEVGEKLGFTFDPGLVHELTGRPTLEFAQRIAKDFKLNTDPKEIVRLKQEAFRKSIKLLKPVNKVISIAREYYGKMPLAVGTGASRKSAELQLDTLGISHLFDVIVTADEVTSHKPEPETFIKCAMLMGVKPEECQVFEDGNLGILAAEKAGMMVTDVRPFINYGQWILS